jgi:hypothetical protein
MPSHPQPAASPRSALRDERTAKKQETAAFVCSHVFDASKPVLLVARENNDLMCMCGEFHEADEAYHVVDAEHLIARDQTLRKFVELPNDTAAERAAIGKPWTHLPLTWDEPNSTT